jgi:hypothetical protein
MYIEVTLDEMKFLTKAVETAIFTVGVAKTLPWIKNFECPNFIQCDTLDVIHPFISLFEESK